MAFEGESRAQRLQDGDRGRHRARRPHGLLVEPGRSGRDRHRPRVDDAEDLALAQIDHGDDPLDGAAISPGDTVPLGAGGAHQTAALLLGCAEVAGRRAVALDRGEVRDTAPLERRDDVGIVLHQILDRLLLALHHVRLRSLELLEGDELPPGDIDDRLVGLRSLQQDGRGLAPEGRARLPCEDLRLGRLVQEHRREARRVVDVPRRLEHVVRRPELFRRQAVQRMRAFRRRGEGGGGDQAERQERDAETDGTHRNLREDPPPWGMTEGRSIGVPWIERQDSGPRAAPGIGPPSS